METPAYHMKGALRDLEVAQSLLRACLTKGGWTISELSEVRRLLLSTVRSNIDPLALGHAREERRY
jgi:hypothetical protein